MYKSASAVSPLPDQDAPLRQSHENSAGVNDNVETSFGDPIEEHGEYDDEVGSDSDADDDSEDLSEEDVRGITAKIEDPRTTLDERKELGRLLLFGGRCESFSPLKVSILKVMNTAVATVAFRPLPSAMPGMEAAGEPGSPAV